jgi:3',5'-cyclic AMP phosphodiesterase CpdA
VQDAEADAVAPAGGPGLPVERVRDRAARLARLFALEPERLYYSFDYANAHFVCLDTLLGRSDPSGKYQAMLEWCEKDLAGSKATWKIVFYHEPSYDLGSYYSKWGRRDAVPLFRKHQVDLVLQGHDHTYARTHKIRAGQVADPKSAVAWE